MSRLIAAEILKLRRRRGMLAICAVLALGAAPVAAATDFDSGIGVLAMLAGVIGAIVGATAGGADIEAGVFRDLAATGRDRTALFLARLPGALAIVLPLLLLSVAAIAVVSADRGDVLDSLVQVLSIGTLTTALTVGLAAVFNARGMVKGGVLAFYLGVAPLLAQVEAIGGWRNLIPQVATARLGGADVQDLAFGTAIAVVLGWIAISTALGIWRTRTQEI